MFMSEKEFIEGNASEKLTCPSCGGHRIEFGDGYEFETSEDYIISREYYYCIDCEALIDVSQYYVAEYYYCIDCEALIDVSQNYVAEKFTIDGFETEGPDDE